MTIEQLKNRQELINEQLYSLLQNTEGVMRTIIGEPPTEEKGLEVAQPSGLLQEISREQDISQMYIERLNIYNQLLINNTYSTEVVCQAR